jgi:chromosome segregation protein
MRLKSIKLAGFKSFVDPTTVNFPANLSAVVGPNGCGKSNIIDAVRWVMGESSAKNLRGESMTDVIFNGSGGRKPVGQASIELIFDNSDGAISGEYASFSEVGIKRRVTREGQNHYFLNGQKCRRKDITDIFLGTGLGPRSYAIIEQGMISRLIESKPEELRIFIEEAAGISKYKERRKETENRMKRTIENLERLTDIREELDRQLQHLQKQADAAEKYTNFKAEERQLSAELLAIEWQELDSIFQAGGSEIDKLSLDLEKVVTEQTRLDAEMETFYESQAQAREGFNKAQDRYYSIGNEIAKAEQIIQNHQQSLEKYTAELEDVAAQVKESEFLKEEDQVQLEQLEEKILAIEPELEAMQEEQEALEESQQLIEEKLQSWQENWENFHQIANQAQQKVEVEQSRIQHGETIITRLNDKKRRLQDELSATGSDESEDVIEALTESIEVIEENWLEKEAHLENAQATIEQLRENTQAQSSQLNQLNTDIQSKKGRTASLEALQQAAFDDGNARLNQWLTTHNLSELPRIADGLKVESGFETAVETVLSEHLQGICVNSLDHLGEAINQLTHTDICLIDEATLDYQGHFSGTPLASKVHGNNHLNSFFAGIYVADSFEYALNNRIQLAANESFITLDGIWVGHNWVKKLGNNAARDGLIARQRELESLTKTLEELLASETALQESHQQTLAQLTDAERQKDQWANELKQLGQEKAQKENERTALQSKIEQMIATKARLKSDLQETHEQLVHEQDQLAESRAVLEMAIGKMAEDSEQKMQLGDEKDRLREEREASLDRLRQLRDKVSNLRIEHQSAATSKNNLIQQQARMDQQLQHVLGRKSQLEESLNNLQQPDQNLQDELEVLLDKRLSAEQDLGIEKDKLEQVEASMRDTEQEKNRLLQENQNIRGELEKSRIAAQGIEVKRETVKNQLTEDNFSLDDVIKLLPEEASKKVWKETLEKTRNRISRLGAINLAAIEEFKVAQERKTYLDSQNEDLEKALNTLENAIRKIDKETRFKFKETFDKINDGVQELFPKVFGGGRAYLEMTGEDLLDTGVAIMAQPPGKKNSTIHLLSGGEKALTAISLVFSIFRLNPAPFCMLDEVDAPLDDANVGRYARMVEEMSKQVQFIYITHNKIAMEMATHLLGVTMHEPGVSRMVTVDVEEAVELASL